MEAETAATYRENLIPFPELSAEISRSSRQDERDEDALTILASHDVEPQPCGSTVDDDTARFPAEADWEGH